jgi:hypothetical protein
MFALSNSPAFKIIENHLGRRFIKVQLHQQMPAPILNIPQPIIDAMMKVVGGGTTTN